MNTGPQGWHQGGADEGEAVRAPAELPPPTEFLRHGAPPALPVRTTTARPLPTTVLWRWRYETAVLSGAPLLWWGTVRSIGGLAGLSAVTFVLAVFALLPPMRRWASAVLWTVVTPHRMRVGCVEAGVVSSRGKLPAVLFTLRKPYGERVYLWCPAGLGATDVASARPAIASACWASDVEFYEMPGSYPQLVAVDVIRLPEALVPTEPHGVTAVWKRFAYHHGRFEGFAPRAR